MIWNLHSPLTGTRRYKAQGYVVNNEKNIPSCAATQQLEIDIIIRIIRNSVNNYPTKNTVYNESET